MGEEVVMMNPSELIPYDNNPRNNDGAVDAVAKSIQEFGFRSPIIVDKNKVIIAGHTRLKASLKLGLDKVPVIIADDLTEEQAKALRLVDNKTNELADWDWDKLKVELDGIKDIEMEDFDFNLSEINENILQNEEQPEAQEDDFNPDENQESFVKRGEIWKLGQNTLMCGDSTSESDVKTLLGGNKVDLVITDPPYNVAYEGKVEGNHMKIANDNMDNDKFKDFLYMAFKNMYDSMKEGASYYVWHSSSESVNFITQLEENDLPVREQLIWAKNVFVLGRQDYQWKHEPCLYGWKDGEKHKWYGARNKTTILEFDKPTSSKLHPTRKPVPLISELIVNSSRKGDSVLDLFGGSGTTLIACEQLQRKCYRMEYDEKYASTIVRRWEELTGKKAVEITDTIGGENND